MKYILHSLLILFGPGGRNQTYIVFTTGLQSADLVNLPSPGNYCGSRRNRTYHPCGLRDLQSLA